MNDNLEAVIEKSRDEFDGPKWINIGDTGENIGETDNSLIPLQFLLNPIVAPKRSVLHSNKG